MLTMKRYPALLAGVLVLLAPMSELGADDCTGIPGSGSEPNLDCLGGCDGSPQRWCFHGFANDAKGPYDYCGCSQTPPPVEPGCCHLILRRPEGKGPYYDVKGSCTVCPLIGSCTLDSTNHAACRPDPH